MFLSSFPTACYHPLLTTTFLVGMEGDPALVLICIFLLANDAEGLFMGSLALPVSSVHLRRVLPYCTV